MGLESFLSSLIFKTVLFGIQGKVQEWFRVTARVRVSVILSLDNRLFLWFDLLVFVRLFFCGKPHEGHQHQKPFYISLLCEGWLKRKHSNTNLSVALFTVVQYFWSFLSLLLISFSSWHVWRSRNTSKARHPGSHSLLCPPMLLQPEVGSRDMASPFLVPSIVALHFLSLCECESCSPLRYSCSSSTYPSMSPSGRMSEFVWGEV